MDVIIDLRSDLPKIRAAYMAGKLQAQTRLRMGGLTGQACTYAGPCAIGVTVSAQERDLLDQHGEILGLLENDLVVAPRNQWSTLNSLQVYHDEWCSRGDVGEANFVRALVDAEATFPPVSVAMGVR